MWRSFVFHLVLYVAIIALLSVIDVAGDDSADWVFYPAAGWGIAVVLHGAVATLVAGGPATALRKRA